MNAKWQLSDTVERGNDATLNGRFTRGGRQPRRTDPLEQCGVRRPRPRPLRPLRPSPPVPQSWSSLSHSNSHFPSDLIRNFQSTSPTPSPSPLPCLRQNQDNLNEILLGGGGEGVNQKQRKREKEWRDVVDVGWRRRVDDMRPL